MLIELLKAAFLGIVEAYNRMAACKQYRTHDFGGRIYPPKCVGGF